MKEVETVTNYTCDYCGIDVNSISDRIPISRFDYNHFCKGCIYLFILTAQKTTNYTWEEWLLKMKLTEDSLNHHKDIH